MLEEGRKIKSIEEAMSRAWENYEPAPMEFFHGRLMEFFHEWRNERTEETTVEINGVELNKLIAKAKTMTKEKYPNHIVRHNAIPKEEMKCQE